MGLSEIGQFILLSQLGAAVRELTTSIVTTPELNLVAGCEVLVVRLLVRSIHRLALRGREVGYTQMVWAKVEMAKDLAVVHPVVMDRMVVDLPADLLADLVGKVVVEMATDRPMAMETIRSATSMSTIYQQIWIHSCEG